MGSRQQVFGGRLYCKEHGRLTCLVCLHSINALPDGSIPDPARDQIPCSRLEHRIEPTFSRFEITLERRGYTIGLSPADRNKYETDQVYKITVPQISRSELYYFRDCAKCGLHHFTGGNRESAIHPSHITPDGQRYFAFEVHPFEISRAFSKIKFTSEFYFRAESKLNAGYTVEVSPDDGSSDWNIENGLIASTAEGLRYVAKTIVPYWEKVVQDFLYTNSEYFARRAKRFALVVVVPFSRSTLDLLLEAHKLKYDYKRKAYVKKNALGFTRARYPATEERRYQVSNLIRRVRELGLMGIEVHWYRCEIVEDFRAARAKFLNKPYIRKASDGLQPMVTQEVPQDDIAEDEGDLIDGDSFDRLPSHDDFVAVRSEASLPHGNHSLIEDAEDRAYTPRAG
ncbi:hypothetical protein M426DRAFT_8055 [Hypoxylon sp. CI-4A]|nr:hypothetical protein M426DRAFT_8055 [Hypoxylon sp. CI-4A]